MDGNKAKNIIVLHTITGSDILTEKVFINQMAPPNKIKKVVEDEDQQLRQVSEITNDIPNV